MSNTEAVDQVPLTGQVTPELNAAGKRFNEELGEQVESLAFMMRKPTEQRPFVYEVRFDLIPGKRRDPMVVLKGFGEEGGLVAFHNASGFLGLLRGVQAQLIAGKVKWYPDQYAGDLYSQRVKRYLGGDFYRAP